MLILQYKQGTVTYASTILGTTSATVVGYWTLDSEGGLTATDSSGNGYHLTKHANSTHVVGQVNEGLEYSVTTIGGLSFGSHSFGANFFNDWSVEMWLYTREDPPTFKPLLELLSGGAPQLGFHLVNGSNYPNGPARLQYAITGGTTTTADAIPLDTWTHIAVTRERLGNTIFYVNGSPFLTTTTSSSPFAGSDSIRQGSTAGNFSLDGIIDETVLYQGVLSGADVLAHYNAGL